MNYFPLAMALAVLPVWAQQKKEPKVETIPVVVGDAKVQIRISRWQGSELIFCHMHEDEKTSVEASAKVLAETGGTLVELIHTGDRRVSYTHDGKKVSVDPNRIFTGIGIRETLDPKVDGADAPAAKLGKKLLDYYLTDKTDVVVAVHNNTDGKYSIKSYELGGDEAVNAEEVHVNKDRDPDDFFYVTDAELFNALKKKGYNAILQNNARAVDDGSLSVYCGQLGIPYVNVEAQHGHTGVQVTMLKDLIAVIDAVKPKRKPVKR